VTSSVHPSGLQVRVVRWTIVAYVALAAVLLTYEVIAL